jgi:hypothetical protein
MMESTSSQVFASESTDRQLFANNFDHTPFLFRHKLHTFDLFQMPALMKLAERLLQKKDKKSHYESGEPVVDGYFGDRPPDVTIAEALEKIPTGRNWVIFKRIHEDPIYRDALESFLPELSNLSGVNIGEVFYDPIMTIFVTSPNRITPYHMDGETNFLAQVYGSKNVYVYDGNDRSTVTAQELERYWTGNLPKLDFPPQLPEGTWNFAVSPGTGVFNPPVFPHWVKNGNNVSISVSINFKRIRNSVIGAYRMNHFTRRLGLKPTEPGHSPVLDRSKDLAFGQLYSSAHKVRTYVRDQFGV